MSFRWTTPSAQLSRATTSGVPPCSATPCDDPVELGGRAAALLVDEPLDGVGGALADQRAVHVDAAHARRRAERDELVLAELALAQAEPLLRQHDDRAALGRLVGERRELRDLGELALLDAVDRQELGRLPVAERDRAGLVEQEHVDVAGRLDRAAGHREHVALHEPVHAGDADRREQRADRGRDERDEQRDQHGLRRRRARVDRERPQRHDGGEERDRQAGEQDVERDLVRRLAPLGALDERDHAVEERLARLLRHLDHEPVGEQPVPPVTAERSPPDSRITGRRLAGDRRLVDRADALDDLAVGGDDLAASTTTTSPLLQVGAPAPPRAAAVDAGGRSSSCASRAARSPAPCRGPRRSPRRSSRRARSARARTRSRRRTRAARVAARELEEEDRRRDHAAELDDEHHRVLELEAAGRASGTSR